MEPKHIIGFMLSTKANMIDKTKFLFRKQTPMNLFSWQQGAAFSNEKAEYLWSANPFDVKQYMKMIDENYDQELHVPDTYKKIGSSDLRSHFFIAKIDQKVIMGVRLTLNDPFLKYSLPTEKEEFNFRDLFTEVDLVNNRYSELTKYTVLDEYRNDLNHYIQGFNFFKSLLDEHNVKYLIICGSRARHRMYKKFASANFKFISMKKLDMKYWPEYSGISFAEDSYAMLLENTDVKNGGTDESK